MARTEKAKTNGTSGKNHSAKGKTNNSGAASTAGYGKLAVLVLLVALVLGGYQYTSKKASTKQAAVPELEVLFEADVEKRDAVVSEFKDAWGAYERDAMGCDEYHPVTKKGSNLTDAGGIGYMVLDAIDTIQLMGLEEEYGRARDWVDKKLTFERDGNFNTFETTIRVLGGLLSAYHLSENDPLYLAKATDLADRLLTSFDTPSGLPMGMVNLAERKAVDDPNVPGLVSTAEATTLQLELKYLAHVTDNENYWEKAEDVMKAVKRAGLPSALVPIYMSANTGQFMLSEIRLGSRGDSYYEYLLKQYLQTNKSEKIYLEMYQSAMRAIHDSLVRVGSAQNLTYTAELIPTQVDGQMTWKESPKQDHLVCFLGGSLMLGASQTTVTGKRASVPPKEEELTEDGKRDWKLGEEIIRTCLATHETVTGLAPEIAHFFTKDDNIHGPRRLEKDWYIKDNDFPGANSYDARYILRPETVESLFIAYRLTGDQKYRDEAWKIFQSIEKHCKVESGGYSSLLNVDSHSKIHMDKMETFFLAETLKYLYLIFSNSSVLPLSRYVFNTEAHPLPIFNPTFRTGLFS